jgi:hypothetical protein
MAKASRLNREDFVGSTPTFPTNFFGVPVYVNEMLDKGEILLVNKGRPNVFVVVRDIGALTQLDRVTASTR